MAEETNPNSHPIMDRKLSNADIQRHDARLKKWTNRWNKSVATGALCWTGIHAGISGYHVATAPPAPTEVIAKARRQLGISGRVMAGMVGEEEATPVDPTMTDSTVDHSDRSGREFQNCYMIPKRGTLIAEIPMKMRDDALEVLGVENDDSLNRARMRYPSSFYSLSDGCSDNVKLRGFDRVSKSGGNER